MGFLSGLGTKVVLNIIGKCSKMAFAEISKSSSYFKLLEELGVNHLKDDFESLYMHCCLIQASKGIHNELVKILLLEDSKEAFHSELRKGEENAFFRSLDSSLHTESFVDELKDKNEFPEEIVKNFFKDYETLTKEVASPVSSAILVSQQDTKQLIKESLSSQQVTNQSLEHIKNKLDLFTEKFVDDDRVQKAYNQQIKSAVDLLDDGLIRRALAILNTLRDESWDELSDETKFKLLTNIGVCHFRLNEKQKSNEAFIKAFECKKTEFAFNNLTNTFIATGDLDKAKETLKKFKESFPGSPLAIATSIRLSEKQSIEEILLDIPDDLHEHEEILLSLGIFSRTTGNYDNSIDYLKKAIKKNPEKALLKEQLLASLLEKYDRNFKIVGLNMIDPHVKEEIHEAYDLCKNLIDSCRGEDVKKNLALLLMNKSVLESLLGEKDESFLTIQEAILADPTEPRLYRHKAILLSLSGKFEEAIQILNGAKSLSDSESKYVLAELYKQTGEYEKGIEIAKSLVKDSGLLYIDLVNILLLEMYILLGSSEEITSIKKVEFTKFKILQKIFHSRIANYEGNPDESIDYLLSAKSQLSSESYDREKHWLVQEFLSYKMGKEAAEVLELIVDKSLNNSSTVLLAEIYYTIGEKGKCLDLVKNLRKVHGPLKYLTELEVSLYQQYHDYKAAQSVGEEFLRMFPNELSMQLRVAGIHDRLDETAKRDAFLIQEIEYLDLKQEEFETYLALLMSANKRQKLFATLYEYRREKNNSYAHLLFIRTLLQFHLTTEECKPPKIPGKDSVIILQSKDESFSWVIEDRPKEELKENEINLQDEKFKLIKNLKLGEKIKFKSSTSEWTFKGLSNKLMFAFQESQLKCNTIYSEENPFTTIHIKDDVVDFLRQLHKEDDESRSFDKVIELYKQRKASIGMIANRRNINPISLWFEFQSQKNIGIHSSFGNTEELDFVIKPLDLSITICGDLIGIITLFELNLGSILNEKFGPIKITPTTKDVILQYKNELLMFGQIDENESWVGRLLGFVNKYCEEEVSSLTYELDSAEKKKLDDMVGLSFLDTILLAKEGGYLFLSDDLLLRGFAEGEYQAKTLWTQALIRFLFSKKVITSNQYQEGIVRLAEMNYIHTSIDEYTILTSLKKRDFKATSSFFSCIRYLNGNISSEDSSILVAISFIYSFKGMDLDDKKKETIVHHVLTSICVRRTIIEVIEKVRGIVLMMQKSRVDEDNRRICNSISEDIASWKKLHGVDDTPITLMIKQSRKRI